SLNQSSALSSTGLSQGLSQEQQYWSMHDRLVPYGIPNSLPNQLLQTNPPTQNPPQEQTPAPSTLTPENPQRQLLQAGSQQPQSFENTDQDMSGARISPDQLSSLLSNNPQATLALASTASGRTPGSVAPGGTSMANPATPGLGSLLGASASVSSNTGSSS